MPEYVSRTKFLHLTSFVGTRSFETQKSLLQSLPKRVKISFDPGALYSGKGLTKIETLINRTYVIMPNRFELQQISGEGDYWKGADFLIGRGVRIVAVKLGEDGCYVTDGSEHHLIEPFEVEVVDTTGAGDAFCAGFLYGLLKDKSLYECGMIGNFVASRCVMKLGARTGLPRVKDLELLR
jgi:ribokinase